MLFILNTSEAAIVSETDKSTMQGYVSLHGALCSVLSACRPPFAASGSVQRRLVLGNLLPLVLATCAGGRLPVSEHILKSASGRYLSAPDVFGHTASEIVRLPYVEECPGCISDTILARRFRGLDASAGRWAVLDRTSGLVHRHIFSSFTRRWRTASRNLQRASSRSFLSRRRPFRH